MLNERLEKIKTPREGDQLLSTLESFGYEGYYVGGCVRDLLMGLEPGDWDICTDATPEEMKACFGDYRTVETGLKHGTLTVLVDHKSFEVTTYRIDGKYSDHRRPDYVKFSRNLKEDLSRRDYTINAMAYHPNRGLVDILGGTGDLKKGLIRCVGQPVKRFREDALRIMRGLRFASRFDFEIEKGTGQALVECSGLLCEIAPERIRVELDKFLCGKGVRRVADEYRQVLSVILPEIVSMFELEQKNPFHAYDVWQHTLRVVENSPPNPVSRLTAFFHDLGKPAVRTVTPEGRGHFYGHEKTSEELTRNIMGRLKYDNATKKKVLNLVRYHGIVFQPTEKYARKMLRRFGEENLFLLVEQSLADVKGQNPVYVPERVERIETFRRKVEKVIEETACFSLKDLAIDGKDLLAEGIPQGKEIGKWLDILLSKVIEGEVENDKEALLDILRNHN